MEKTPHILTLMVDNEFGVLTRITSQIRREGWNIKSLAVAESTDSAISRITLALECFDTTLPMVVQRLVKLACVQSVSAYDPAKQVCRELAVAVVHLQDGELAGIIEQFNPTILSRQNGATTMELVGTPARLLEFVQELNMLNERSVARTGPITLDIQ